MVSAFSRNRHLVLSAIIVLFLCGAAGAQVRTAERAGNLRMAMIDFSIESENPQYKYLGKGFVELISVELSKVKGVSLIEREKRNALLDEMEFSLSDMADPAKAAQLGKLMAADYLVQGIIIDMMGDLVVTCSIVRVETGEIVGKADATGPAKEYKRMVRELGTGIARLAGKEAQAIAALGKPETAPVAKQAEVLTSISEAVEAIDKKDAKTATAKLTEAKKIDPKDETVKYLLDLLQPGTSKFSVIPDPYFSLDNPASLGLAKTDSIYAKGAGGGTLIGGQDWGYYYPMIPSKGSYGVNAPTETTGETYGTGARYGIREMDGRLFLGATVPIGATLGAGLQGYFAHEEWNLLREGDVKDRDMSQSLDMYGGALSFGWAPSALFSIGASGGAGVTDPYSIRFSDTVGDSPYPSVAFYSAELGIIVKNYSSSLVYSLTGGYSSYRAYMVETTDMSDEGQKGGWIHFDHSITWGINRMRDFLVLRHITGQYGFETGPTMQVITAWEHWFGKDFSLRLGGIGTFSLMDKVTGGFGGSVGATWKFGAWELDGSATYRVRNSYAIYDETIPETLFSVGVKESGLVMKRK
jgi:TolB-like protein